LEVASTAMEAVVGMVEARALMEARVLVKVARVEEKVEARDMAVAVAVATN